MSKKLSLPSTITLIKFKLYSTYYSAVSGLHNKLFLPVSKYFDKKFSVQYSKTNYYCQLSKSPDTKSYVKEIILLYHNLYFLISNYTDKRFSE